MAKGWIKINTERPYSLVNIILNYQSYSVATEKKKKSLLKQKLVGGLKNENYGFSLTF